MHTLKGAGNTIIKGNSGSDSSHRDHHLSWRMAGALMVSAPALFAFNFLLLLLFSFHPNINGRNDEGPFTAGQSIKGGRCQMKFVKAIVSNVRFTITFTD